MFYLDSPPDVPETDSDYYTAQGDIIVYYDEDEDDTTRKPRIEDIDININHQQINGIIGTAVIETSGDDNEDQGHIRPNNDISNHLWDKQESGIVAIPFQIVKEATSHERKEILKAIDEFTKRTFIR